MDEDIGVFGCHVAFVGCLDLVGHVENSDKISRKAQLDAFDNISAARPVVDELLGRYAAVLTPSVPDEAPLGIEKTGSAAFCLIWTVRFLP